MTAVPWLILTLAVVAAGMFLLWRVMRNRHTWSEDMVERVRTTAVYRKLWPVIAPYEGRCVEQILLRREGVTIRLFRPMKEQVRFQFTAHGLDEVDSAEVLQALARALARDLPMLDDPDKFWLVRKTMPRDLGRQDVWFEYNVQPAYRDALLRADYDRPGERR